MAIESLTAPWSAASWARRWTEPEIDVWASKVLAIKNIRMAVLILAIYSSHLSHTKDIGFPLDDSLVA
jgi:hypothetical protein